MSYPTNTYPTGLQTPPDPTATSDTSTFDHAGLESFQNDSIVALKTKVGITGSADNTTIDYKLSGVATGDKAVSKTGTETLTNKTLTSPTLTSPTTTGTDAGLETLQNKILSTGTKILLGSDATGDMYYNGGSGTATRIPIGSSNQILGVVGGVPTYQSGSAFGLTKFGGTGADGALNVPSGTTTINLANAAVFVKNYTSINIASGATVNFSNPGANGTIIVLKSQGNVTILGTLDASGMGATGGNAANGNTAEYIFGGDSSNGKQGSSLGGSGTTGGAVYTIKNIYSISSSTLFRKMNYITPGSGGGSGGLGTGPTAGGLGGNGGGGLYIECNGSWNFTGTISVAGLSGGTGTAASAGNGGGGGGGGGAGGMLVSLYNTLTANSGTVTLSGGNGGAGGAGSSSAGGGGASGAGMYNGAGGAGLGHGAAGGNGSNSLTTGTGGGVGGTFGGGGSSTDGGGGGGGTAGEYFITLNTEFT